MNSRIFLVVLSITLVLASCSQATTSTSVEPTIAPAVSDLNENEPLDEESTDSVPQGPLTNMIDDCVKDYDPSIDYFPDKVTLQEAEGFEVEYFNNYKVVTILTPYREAEETFQYVLVQCGTPVPSEYENALVIEVPVQSIVALSSRYFAPLRELGLYDKLTGIDFLEGVFDPELLRRAEAGEVIAVGAGADVNVEQVITLEPDLVMTYAGRQSEANAHPKLLEAGVKVAINAEYMESTALGRAEWIKYLALFFNKEEAATDYFNGTASRYHELVAIAKEAETAPTVLWGLPGADTWFMPGGAGFYANLIKDAGAQYPWSDDTSTGIMPLAFEAVFERAGDADFWLAADGYPTMAEMLAADQRLAEIGPLKRDNVWANDALMNDNFGNDYWESGVIDADVLLADLIAIFHPELMPDYELTFWRKFN